MEMVLLIGTCTVGHAHRSLSHNCSDIHIYKSFVYSSSPAINF